MQAELNQQQLKQPIILTPQKLSRKPQQKQQPKKYCKFKGTQPENLYIPKFRINSLKSSELQLAYIYKINSLQHIGNVQQWSQNKVKENSDSKNLNELVSEVRKKGIRDFTMCIKRRLEDKGSQSSSIFIGGASPFKSDRILNYFEIKLLDIYEQSLACFSFGISSSQQSLNSFKNSISLSCKLSSQKTLQIYRNNNKMQQINDFQMNLQDTIGFGFIYHRNQIFITHNKHIIIDKLKLYIPEFQDDKLNKNKKTAKQFVQTHNHRYYPFIQLESKKIFIQVIFQNSFQCFRFPFTQQLNKLQEKLMQVEITKSVDMSEESIYGLVLSYFKFNGYEKTSQNFQSEMMKRDMKFYPQNYPIKNKLEYGKKQCELYQIGKQKKIKKRTRKVISERSRRSMEQGLLTPQMNEQLPYHGQDQDSHHNNHYQSDDEQNVRSKRKVIEDTEVLISKQRLESEQRRRQQEVNNYLNKKIQKKYEEMRRTLEQKYKIERILIMRNILDGKIDQALKLFSKSYKMIHMKQKYLEVFFKAHLFLKYYNEQGLQKALQYAKKEDQNFTEYENYLMPFFNSKSLKNESENQFEYRPLRQILFLICPERKEQFNIHKQFYIFSQFISQVICEHSGFFGTSKLELALNSYKVAEKKISQYEIPIGGFDLEAMGLI